MTFLVDCYGGYSPPLKTRFFEGSASLDLAVADFRKKVRFSPPVDGPEGEKIPLFFSFENRRQQGLGAAFLKNWSKRGVPLFWALFDSFGDFR